MAPSVMNLTITVPYGTSNHGDPSLLCTPTHWTSILAFFLGNYIAHAATTLSYPGEEFGGYLQTIIIALLFPTAGVVRGFDAIFRCAILATSDLMCAARAGALCMVIRINDSEERPRTHHAPATTPRRDLGRGNANLTGVRTELTMHQRRLRGQTECHISALDEGVSSLLVLPTAGSQVALGSSRSKADYFLSAVLAVPIVLSGQLPLPSTRDKPIVISTSRNAARAVVAIVQTCYGAFTLYRTRGDQIARYGYAAFGLTVAPYTIMSIINLLGSVLMPSYPTMYLVRSEVMDEIDSKFGRDGRPYFDGMVGVLEEVKHEDADGPISGPQFCLLAAVSIGIPLAIIGGLTKFHRGDSSTHAQRVWLMTWL
ncbi:hypothetical protein C8F01DRAFT_1034920, partial [Mycena amicta]